MYVASGYHIGQHDLMSQNPFPKLSGLPAPCSVIRPLAKMFSSILGSPAIQLPQLDKNLTCFFHHFLPCLKQESDRQQCTLTWPALVRDGEISFRLPVSSLQPPAFSTLPGTPARLPCGWHRGHDSEEVQRPVPRLEAAAPGFEAAPAVAAASAPGQLCSVFWKSLLDA